jgi:glycosyltransferase involved in cell wall biosynthesis
MRILWFTNTSSNAPIDNKTVRGGWISSLENALTKHRNIELGIVFMHHKAFFSKVGNTSYYGIQENFNTKSKRVFQRYFNLLLDSVKEEELNIIIKKFKPDLIHIHGTENDFCQLLTKENIPSVVSIQGNMTVYTHKYFSGLAKQDIRPETSIKDYVFKSDVFTRYSMFKKKARREENYLKSAKHVIGRTDWDRNIMRILAPKAKYYLGNEILRPEFYDKVWSKKQKREKFILVSVIGSNIFKGLETILHAARLLKQVNFEFEWNLIGVQKDDLIYRAAIKFLNLGSNDININILGQLDADALINQLLESNLYVSVSHIENSPNNVCEAMLLGMPIISTFAGGTSSILNHKKEGILIQDGDPWNLAGNIIEIFKNYNLALELGKNARKTAILRHASDNVAKQYIKMYEQVLEANNLN